MQTTLVKCNVCGREKVGPVRWYRVAERVTSHGVSWEFGSDEVVAVAPNPLLPATMVGPAAPDGRADLCSGLCLHKYLDRIVAKVGIA